LVIGDLRYKPGQDLQLRQPPIQLVKLVFANADRIGRCWSSGPIKAHACGLIKPPACGLIPTGGRVDGYHP
jgi:hypothetical protein